MTFENYTYLSWYKYEESLEIKIYNDDILMVKTGSTYRKVGIVKNLEKKQ
jgi:type I restriction enzyme S subunit